MPSSRLFDAEVAPLLDAEVAPLLDAEVAALLDAFAPVAVLPVLVEVGRAHQELPVVLVGGILGDLEPQRNEQRERDLPLPRVLGQGPELGDGLVQDRARAEQTQEEGLADARELAQDDEADSIGRGALEEAARPASHAAEGVRAEDGVGAAGAEDPDAREGRGDDRAVAPAGLARSIDSEHVVVQELLEDGVAVLGEAGRFVVRLEEDVGLC